MDEKPGRLSAASSLLSLTNLSSTHMSFEKSDETSSVFSDATETDELGVGSSVDGSIEQGVDEKQNHNVTDLADLPINKNAVIERHDEHYYNCKSSNADYVKMAEKVASSIIGSARAELELEALATACVNDALAKVGLDVALNQNDSWQQGGKTGRVVISPYLGTGVPQGANYASTSARGNNTTTQSSKMENIEAAALEQVNIAIARAQAVLREEQKPAQVHQQPTTVPRRRKINIEIEPTVELINDPTDEGTNRSDENDNAQIGFIIISLITLFLIIKLVAKLGGFLLELINP